VKGVGVYFVTQNPLDVPDRVLRQLGNRIQHALRAYTPREQRAVRTAAETLRANPVFDTERAISELATGEALVSCLDAKGAPTVVERAWMMAPASRLGVLLPGERAAILQASPMRGRYETPVDRESAFEKLEARAKAKAATEPGGSTKRSPDDLTLSERLFGHTGPRGGRHEGILESAARSAARSIRSGVGRSLLRGVLGSLLRR